MDVQNRSGSAGLVNQSQLRESLFGPLVDGRECGDCVACCIHTQIDTPELVKPLGQACRHCTNTGCAIYETRFPVCRSWQCLWKHVGALPDEFRPDLCGLMIVLDQQESPQNLFCQLCIRIMVIDAGKVDANPQSGAVVDMFCQGDLPVWVDDGSGDLVLLHPAERIASYLLADADSRAAMQPSLDTDTLAAIDCWRSGVRLDPEPPADSDVNSLHAQV